MIEVGFGPVLRHHEKSSPLVFLIAQGGRALPSPHKRLSHRRTVVEYTGLVSVNEAPLFDLLFRDLSS